MTDWFEIWVWKDTGLMLDFTNLVLQSLDFIGAGGIIITEMLDFWAF